jgi:hypothetical protein
VTSFLPASICKRVDLPATGPTNGQKKKKKRYEETYHRSHQLGSSASLVGDVVRHRTIQVLILFCVYKSASVCQAWDRGKVFVISIWCNLFSQGLTLLPTPISAQSHRSLKPTLLTMEGHLRPRQSNSCITCPPPQPCNCPSNQQCFQINRFASHPFLVSFITHIYFGQRLHNLQYY